MNLLLPALPRDFAAPVLIVVHVRQGQRSLLSDLFFERYDLRVVEPFDKDLIAAGTAYFAPPGYHMLVEAEGGDTPAIALSVDSPVRFSRPSVDVLFESAAPAMPHAAIAQGVVDAHDVLTLDQMAMRLSQCIARNE